MKHAVNEAPTHAKLEAHTKPGGNGSQMGCTIRANSILNYSQDGDAIMKVKYVWENCRNALHTCVRIHTHPVDDYLHLLAMSTETTRP